MKKMLIAALCLLTLSGSAMAAQNVPKELQMSGTVTENTGSMITVKNIRQRCPAYYGQHLYTAKRHRLLSWHQ